MRTPKPPRGRDGTRRAPATAVAYDTRAPRARRALAASALRQRQFKEVLEESPHLEALLKDLPTPTHILWGEEDRLVHVDCVRVLRELLPNSSATVLRGVGHIPMLETPAKAAQDYLAFRERLIFGTDLLPEVA